MLRAGFEPANPASKDLAGSFVIDFFPVADGSYNNRLLCELVDYSVIAYSKRFKRLILLRNSRVKI